MAGQLAAQMSSLSLGTKPRTVRPCHAKAPQEKPMQETWNCEGLSPSQKRRSTVYSYSQKPQYVNCGVRRL